MGEKVLYIGAYQRRETLRFYGISEDSEGEEGTQQVLKSFMQSELGIENASSRLNSKGYTELMFTTLHSTTKPHQIITRFFRYQDRERVMIDARNLKG